MNNLQKVTDEKGLVRDKSTNAVLNVDIAAKVAFMKERESKNTISNIQTALTSVQVDIKEIKHILKSLSLMRCEYAQISPP